ncbi:MAG: ATP-dependent DNA ligase, partial [Pyrinomonadaceae bacterium]|nr:ATP-dependent DNA ligase [Sphingobacteriaceae bacterium]
DIILPFLRDKPLSLNRHPNGIDSPNFFQKDLDTEQIPEWIKYQPMYSESVNKDIDYLICNDMPSLLWMANLGCIEINPWLSTFKVPDNPVFAVMDLDPNDVDDFKEVIRVALTARSILKHMGINSWIKTSGSRGLHIFVHVAGKYDYEIVKNFVHHLALMIMEQHPESTSLEHSPLKRKKKIYLDFLQNRRGQTISAPYSARPKPGATVSTPLEWDEVNENLDIKAFTIFNTINRIKEKGELWKDIFNEKADLKIALKAIK